MKSAAMPYCYATLVVCKQSVPRKTAVPEIGFFSFQNWLRPILILISLMSCIALFMFSDSALALVSEPF